MTGEYVDPWDGRLHLESAHALYLHVPFCVSKCAYCDFTSYATAEGDARMGAYASALSRLVEEAEAAGLLEGFRTAYVGGGTPSLLGPEVLSHVISTVCAGRGLSELTFEANPESLTDGLLDACVEAGATRVSIGVQSLDDDELSRLGRVHDSARAISALDAALRSGLDVSCDLMCGIPAQTGASWADTLSRVMSMGVRHVSVYPLMVEKGTRLARSVEEGEEVVPDEDEAADRMVEAERVLGEAGLRRYEVASYADAGHACIHNEAYWTGVPYLGLGTSAASMLTAEGYLRARLVCPDLPEPDPSWVRVRLSCTSDVPAVARARGLADLAFDVEGLTSREAAAEDLMLGARMMVGIVPALAYHARATIGGGPVDSTFSHLVSEGLARMTPEGGLEPTERGWLLGNEMYGELWDLAEGTIAHSAR